MDTETLGRLWIALVIPVWIVAFCVAHFGWELPSYVVAGPGLLAATVIALPLAGLAALARRN